jgi:hypothetical protein
MKASWKRLMAPVALGLVSLAVALLPMGQAPRAQASPIISLNLPMQQWYVPATGGHWATANPAAAAYGVLQGTLGYVLTEPLPGTTLLYDCQMGNDRFNSLSSTCEGQTVSYEDGYVYAAPAPWSVAIYRCWNGIHHLTTTSTTCQGLPGYHLEGPLGWLSTQPLTIPKF